MEVAVATQGRPTTWVTHVPAVALGTVMFAFIVALRFLTTTSFSNDEYVSLAGAQQMLFGEWPTRDFLDTGAPLMYTASAAAQLVFGRNLFAEAMMTALSIDVRRSGTAYCFRVKFRKWRCTPAGWSLEDA